MGNLYSQFCKRPSSVSEQEEYQVHEDHDHDQQNMKTTDSGNSSSKKVNDAKDSDRQAMESAPPERDPALQEIVNKWGKEQTELKSKLITEDTEEWQKALNQENNELDSLKYVGGVDISFVKDDPVNACAALIILSYPDLKVVYEDLQMIKLTAPYVPGFLAFREAPFLVDMVNTLQEQKPDLLPQVIMVDGNGILHPKGFGLACQLGVIIDIPCLGVAKTLFHVDGIMNDKDHKDKIGNLGKGGDTFPLVGSSGRTYGMALKSCDSTKNPIYISPGHKISMDTAVKIVAKCCNFRIPEPTRQADILSREYLRNNFTS